MLRCARFPASGVLQNKRQRAANARSRHGTSVHGGVTAACKCAVDIDAGCNDIGFSAASPTRFSVGTAPIAEYRNPVVAVDGADPDHIVEPSGKAGIAGAEMAVIADRGNDDGTYSQGIVDGFMKPLDLPPVHVRRAQRRVDDLYAVGIRPRLVNESVERTERLGEGTT